MAQSSDSELSYDTDDSEYNFIPGILDLRYFEEEDENEPGETDIVEKTVESIEPYSDEPLADEEWLKEYRKKKDMEDKLRNELKKRIDGEDPCRNW